MVPRNSQLILFETFPSRLSDQNVTKEKALFRFKKGNFLPEKSPKWVKNDARLLNSFILLYADDCDLVSHSQADMQTIMDLFASA